MPIVSNTAGLLLPDVYVVEKEPPVQVTARSTGVIGIVGQFTYGPIGETILVGDSSDLVRKTGSFKNGLDGHMAILNIMDQGANQIKIVRVTDGDEEKAGASLLNGASGIVDFEMEHPGTEGNLTTVTIAAASVSGYVNASFNFNGQTLELRQVNMDPNSDDYLVDKVNKANSFVKATRVSSTVNLALPAVGTTTFTDGLDGTLTGVSLTDADYVGTVGSNSRTGLKVFETDEGFANIIVSARATDTINAEIVTQASNTSLKPRMGIIAPTAGTSVAGAKTAVSSINSDYAVMTYPFLTKYNVYTKQKENFNPAPFYAGLLATLSPHVSQSRKQISGIIGTEMNLSRPEVVDLTENRISPITVMPSIGFVVRNGFTTSSNGGKRQTVRRRMLNYFINKWEPSAQAFVSRGHTKELRDEIKTFFSNDLERDLRAGRIGNASGGPAYSVKCDTENNPSAIVQANQLVVDIAVSLIAPADILVINIDASEENTRISG